MEHDHAEHQAGTRTAAPPASARSSAPGGFASILGLQASAGNRATEQYLQRMTERVDQVLLQREANLEREAPVQRDEMDGLGGDAPEALDTSQAAASSAFSDKVNVTTTEVPIVVRNNAFD